jgi:hypothetical protein
MPPPLVKLPEEELAHRRTRKAARRHGQIICCSSWCPYIGFKISAVIGTVTMKSSGAYKKATAALDEAARARIRGPFISDVAPPSAPSSPGADATADDDDDLMGLVDEFYNGYGEHGTDGGVAKDAVAPPSAEWKETLRLTLADAAGDAAAARICAEAERIVRDAGPAAVGSGGMRTHLVERLRARGFNAGKCSTPTSNKSSIPHALQFSLIGTLVSNSYFDDTLTFSSRLAGAH